jgi:sulfur carrier protein ThiS
MRVLLRPQQRTVDLTGRRTVARMLRELGIVPGTAMVIRNDTLLLETEIVEEDDEIEVRAVISGGAA